MDVLAQVHQAPGDDTRAAPEIEHGARSLGEQAGQQIEDLLQVWQPGVVRRGNRRIFES